MTISFVNVSANCPTAQLTNTNSGNDSLSVEYPASLQEGDLILLMLAQKATDGASSDFNTPTDFTAVSDANNTGGTGSYAADTGICRIRVFYRVAGSTPPSGSLTHAPPGGNSTQSNLGYMIAFRSTNGASETWDVAGSQGADSTTGTPFTATMGADPGGAGGDAVIAVGQTPTDVNAGTAKYSSASLTWTGITTGAATNFYASNYPNTSHNNDHGGPATYWILSSGTSSAAPSVSWTVSGTTTNIAGPILIVRAREAAAPAPKIFGPTIPALTARGRSG